MYVCMYVYIYNFLTSITLFPQATVCPAKTLS